MARGGQKPSFYVTGIALPVRNAKETASWLARAASLSAGARLTVRPEPPRMPLEGGILHRDRTVLRRRYMRNPCPPARFGSDRHMSVKASFRRSKPAKWIRTLQSLRHPPRFRPGFIPLRSDSRCPIIGCRQFLTHDAHNLCVTSDAISTTCSPTYWYAGSARNRASWPVFTSSRVVLESESMEPSAGGRMVPALARWWSRRRLHLISRSSTPASPLCQCRVLQPPPRPQGALSREAGGNRNHVAVRGLGCELMTAHGEPETRQGASAKRAHHADFVVYGTVGVAPFFSARNASIGSERCSRDRIHHVSGRISFRFAVLPGVLPSWGVIKAVTISTTSAGRGCGSVPPRSHYL